MMDGDSLQARGCLGLNAMMDGDSFEARRCLVLNATMDGDSLEAQGWLVLNATMDGDSRRGARRGHRRPHPWWSPRKRLASVLKRDGVDAWGIDEWSFQARTR